jgi:hypothetical protein
MKGEILNDYSYSNNFTYCLKCGLEEYYKSYCSICRETASPNSIPEESPEYNPLVCCSKCKLWSHVHCSIITYPQYQVFLFPINVCRKCLKKRKNLNASHAIFEKELLKKLTMKL